MSYIVVQRSQTASDGTIRPLAQFHPSFWWCTSLYNKNMRFQKVIQVNTFDLSLVSTIYSFNTLLVLQISHVLELSVRLCVGKSDDNIFNDIINFMCDLLEYISLVNSAVLPPLTPPILLPGLYSKVPELGSVIRYQVSRTHNEHREREFSTLFKSDFCILKELKILLEAHIARGW